MGSHQPAGNDLRLASGRSASDTVAPVAENSRRPVRWRAAGPAARHAHGRVRQLRRADQSGHAAGRQSGRGGAGDIVQLADLQRHRFGHPADHLSLVPGSAEDRQRAAHGTCGIALACRPRRTAGLATPAGPAAGGARHGTAETARRIPGDCFAGQPGRRDAAADRPVARDRLAAARLSSQPVAGAQGRASADAACRPARCLAG